MDNTETDIQGEKPILNITGEQVALGPVRENMIPTFLRWANDFTVTSMSGKPLLPVSRAQIEDHFIHRSPEEYTSSINFAIFERASLQVIGVTTLTNIDRAQRTARYTIVIGEKNCWGKGYGTETTILVLDYAFTVLGLHNVILKTAGYNERAMRAYTRAGFRVMGRQREAARLGDQVHDIIFMDCLATEFRSPLKRVIELP